MFRNLSAKYYQENNERLHNKIVKYIKAILKKKKKKKRQYGWERYKYLSEDEKQKLVEYRKDIKEWEKMTNNHYMKLLFSKIMTWMNERSFDEE